MLVSADEFPAAGCDQFDAPLFEYHLWPGARMIRGTAGTDGGISVSIQDDRIFLKGRGVFLAYIKNLVVQLGAVALSPECVFIFLHARISCAYPGLLYNEAPSLSSFTVLNYAILYPENVNLRGCKPLDSMYIMMSGH